jgi:hypothetical protein
LDPKPEDSLNMVSMRNIPWLLLLAMTACALGTARAADVSPALLAVSKVRFLPLAGHKNDMLGARILASNLSANDGFIELAEIRALPASGQWGELTFNNATPYRWIKYLAAPGTYGRVSKLEFYAGGQKLTFKPGQIYSSNSGDPWNPVLDEKPGSPHESDLPDNQYVAIDLGVAATGPSPVFVPGQTESKDPVQVAIQSKIPGTVIRYTLDGTAPTLENSQVYSAPLNIDKTTTLEASAFVEGYAPTPPIGAAYIIGEPVTRNTFHVGNSLTGITQWFDTQARTTGAIHHSTRYLIGGALTKALWNAAMLPIPDPADKKQWMDLYGWRPSESIVTRIKGAPAAWKKLWPGVTEIDDFTLQPRDFDIAEEADYDNRFLSLVQQKAPNVQPWLYIEWVERDRKRPTDLGREPTSEMQKVYPALTWEESMAAMMLYGEDLKRKVDETYKRPLRKGGL